jgi:hypothetical protein
MMTQYQVTEYIMKQKILTTSAVLLSLFAANAMAAVTVCPSAASIEQKKEEQGYSYSAPGPNGRVWVGEHPYADEGDLETFVFTGAIYRDISSENNTDVVSCDYEGDNHYAGARMTLYSFRGWAPVNGTKWKPQPTAGKAEGIKKATYVEYCDSRIEKECEFNYKFLTAPSTGK